MTTPPQTLSDLMSALAPLAVPGATPPAAEEGAPAPAPAPQIALTEHAKRGTDLDVTVSAAHVVAAAGLLDRAGYMIEAITGVDWIAEKQIEVVYDYTLWVSGARVTVRARISRETPSIPTISGVYPGANWHERETHDFFGVDFTGHPDLTPLLLPEDATFHPLRKDFGT